MKQWLVEEVELVELMERMELAEGMWERGDIFSNITREIQLQ